MTEQTASSADVVQGDSAVERSTEANAAADVAAGPTREGLLIDWGGVLTSNLFISFHAFCSESGVDFEELGRRFLSDQEFRALLVGLETGELSEREFEPRLATLLGVPAEGLIDSMMAGVQPDLAMIEAVRCAHDLGIRTALVSNSWGIQRYPHELFAEIFDGLVISGEVGMRKPAPAMYELGAQRAGLPAERCVFIDDLPHNLEPAAALGMATIHHTDSAKTIPDLERLLGLSLSLTEPGAG